jgi:HEPN domain-containing protein
VPRKLGVSLWLRFAQDDLKAARALLDEELYHVVCFHAQQATEKAVKAFLAFSQGTIPREHRLATLLERAVRAKLTGQGLDRACKILDQYYLPTRYPDAIAGSLPEGLPSRRHALEAIHLAEAVLRAIKRSLRRKPTPIRYENYLKGRKAAEGLF